MDTEQARTFLAVVAAGSFVSAAERLHVSQSTVSTRIATLEELLGCRLFVRNKGGAALTPTGRRFQKHASTLVRAVEQARHDVGIPEGFRATLTIGARIGLWEEFLLRQLAVILGKTPGIAIRAEIGLEPELMEGLVEGRLDFAVLYTPESRPGLHVEPLFEERLVLVSTRPTRRPVFEPDYVYIDWGPEFRARHSTSFPEFFGAPLTVNIGWLGLEHVLANGGSGYFPLRLVRDHLQAGRLRLCAAAPEFSLMAYLVFPADADEHAVGPALTLVRQSAEREKRLGKTLPARRGTRKAGAATSNAD